MKVFIGWSGQRSKAAAQALVEWLPEVIHGLQPWMSDSDIDLCDKWDRNFDAGMADSRFCILCLTRENMNSAWMVYASGVLAHTVTTSNVCPYLVSLEHADLRRGPLSSFQSRRANEHETWELVQTINRCNGDSARAYDALSRSFKVWWPHLEQSLAQLPDDSQNPVQLSQLSMAEETLSIVRGIASNTGPDQFETVLSEFKLLQSDIQALLGTYVAGAELAPAAPIVPEGKSTEIEVTFRNLNAAPVTIRINDTDTLFTTLNRIWNRFPEAHQPPPSSYLTDWVIVRTLDKVPLVVRTHLTRLPARFVFPHYEQWEVVSLTEPMLNMSGFVPEPSGPESW